MSSEPIEPASAKKPVSPKSEKDGLIRRAGRVASRGWRSLGGRLALLYVVVTSAAFIAVAWVFAARTNALVDQEGQLSAETTLDHYRYTLDNGGIDALRTLVGTPVDGPSVAVRVTDERDSELLRFATDDASDRASNDLRRPGAEKSESTILTPRRWNVATAVVSANRRLEVVVRNDAGPRLWERAREDLWLIFAIALASIVLGAFIISRRALRPVGELAKATRKILDSGDLGLRVSERGADDLDEVTHLFNRMLDRNETVMRTMKQSLDNVAHDLRTPLTRLRTGAELALRDPSDPERAKETLSDVIEESDRVLGMLTALMDIAEAETGAMRLDKRPEDLSAIAREAVDLYDHVSNERGVHIVTNLAKGVVVLGDHQRLAQVAANLLDNAIKYTEPGGNIELRVQSDKKNGTLTVEDTGMGIAAEDIPHIWERLFRGDRSRAQRGLGLGLSLVKAVVEAHGGGVEARSEVGKGTTFTVRLPLANP